MNKLGMGALAAAGLLIASGAQAQSFTYDIDWGDVDMVGGIGPEGDWARGGSVAGTYRSRYEDGRTASGTIRCVGMDQPSASMFAVHLSCDASSQSGTTAIAYGCNYLGEPGPDTPLGCVGAIRGSAGAMTGRQGVVTMHWHSQNEARGTGQWYAQ